MRKVVLQLSTTRNIRWHSNRSFLHRVHTEWQWPLSGVHSIMMEKIVQVGEGGGARSPPFSISTVTYKVVVYAPAERADTFPQYYSTSICTLWFSQPSGGGGGTFRSLCTYHGKKTHVMLSLQLVRPPTSLPPFMLASIEKSYSCHTGRRKTKREGKGAIITVLSEGGGG